jgi:hypothetical protein
MFAWIAKLFLPAIAPLVETLMKWLGIEEEERKIFRTSIAAITSKPSLSAQAAGDQKLALERLRARIAAREASALQPPK